MEIRSAVERIARLRENEIGPTEENVKQKVIVPILELLGHNRDNLEFEYRTRRGGKLDILIKKVRSDCKVIIDTKNYSENLNDYIDQIKEYTFDESPLLAIIANGTEIRIYSLLRGIAFEKSLLYSIKREDLAKESVWEILTSFLQHDDLQNGSAVKRVEERERDIKDAISKEEDIRREYEQKVEEIDGEVESMEENIEELTRQREELGRQSESRISEVWAALGLPSEVLRIGREPDPGPVGPGGWGPSRTKARRVAFQELVNARLLRDGQTLYFYHTRLFQEEQAQVLASQNKLKYALDGRTYSISDLALRLLQKHGFKRDDHGVAGPKYWRTEDEKTIHELNERVRAGRGDRD